MQITCRTWTAFILVVLGTWISRGQNLEPNAPAGTNRISKLRSSEDGWLDISGFLDQSYGFIPIVIPITEPAVGYGAAGGLAFIDKPLKDALAGFGRPNITAVGGLGTENGSWGVAAADIRQWLDDKLQTQVILVDASVNLDFYGLGRSSLLADDPVRYVLQPIGGLIQGKYRLGQSRSWLGLGYAYSTTEVKFDAPQGRVGLPDAQGNSNVGGVIPSLSYDSRDNIFTTTRGSFVEASAGFFSEALGGYSEFQRPRLTVMQFFPLSPKWTLGLRADVAASFGDVPFYLRPYISLRGAPAMRYQGAEIAQTEAELRWQFWKRFSLVGFVGGGGAWNNLERFDNAQTIITGGTGFRYELARKYGIHMGLDIAFGPDNQAIYVQIGSAWVRP